MRKYGAGYRSSECRSGMTRPRAAHSRDFCPYLALERMFAKCRDRRRASRARRRPYPSSLGSWRHQPPRGLTYEADHPAAHFQRAPWWGRRTSAPGGRSDSGARRSSPARAGGGRQDGDGAIATDQEAAQDQLSEFQSAARLGSGHVPGGCYPHTLHSFRCSLTTRRRRSHGWFGSQESGLP